MSLCFTLACPRPADIQVLAILSMIPHLVMAMSTRLFNFLEAILSSRLVLHMCITHVLLPQNKPVKVLLAAFSPRMCPANIQ